MSNTKSLQLLPFYILFIVVAIVLWLFQGQLTILGFDTRVIHAANIIFFLLNFISFFIQKSALQNSNPNAFIRSVIGGMMIKMFGTVIAVLLYVVIVGDGYNKPSVFASLILYLVYLAVEVAVISKLNKKM